MYFNEKSKTRSLILALTLAASPAALAHNQNPATIRKAMTRAFGDFDASLPKNIYKGQRSLRVAGANAQVWDIKKEDKLVGHAVQIEVQEENFVISVDKQTGKIKTVVRAGSVLPESDWKELSFVEEVRKAVSEK